jgi:hypothetical protein
MSQLLSPPESAKDAEVRSESHHFHPLAAVGAAGLLAAFYAACTRLTKRESHEEMVDSLVARYQRLRRPTGSAFPSAMEEAERLGG